MTQDEIIKLAEQANGEPAWSGGVDWTWDELEVFAKLIAQHEREKFCAVLRQLHDSYSLASDSNAIKAALEAKDETFMASYEHKQYGYYKDESGSLKLGDIPQHKWVGLTDVNAVELWQLARHDIVEFARAIEAKLKEKNT